VYSSPAFNFTPVPYTPFPFECDICTNATHYFWGFSTTIINWTLVVQRARLARLTEKDYM
jgi:cbb3-type cytochrome oxidase subunit 1